MRGCAQGNLANLDAAIADFTAAIELKPQEPLYYHERSVAHRQRGAIHLAELDRLAVQELDKGKDQG